MKKLILLGLLFIPSISFGFTAIDPTTIFGTNLQLWLDGGDDTSMYTTSTETGTIVSVGNGAPVCAWKDKSGNGHDALQVTQANCPTWAFNQFTGANGGAIPSVTFNGSSQRLIVTSLFDSTFNTNLSAFYTANVSTTGTTVVLQDQSNVWYIARSNSLSLKVQNLTPNSGYPSTSYTSPGMDGISYNGSQYLIYGSVTRHQPATGNLGLGSNLAIGAQYGSFGFSYSGGIGDVIIVKGVPSQAQLAQLENYESQKYGLYVTTRTYAHIYCDGNSLTYGYKPSDTTAQNVTPANYPTQLQSVLAGAGIGAFVVNKGVTGIRTDQMVTNSTAGIQTAYINTAPVNIDVFWEITNDLVNQVATNNAATSAANAYANVVQYCNLVRAAGFKIAVVTCIDRRGIGANQTVFDNARATVNANIAQNWRTFADYLVDIGENSALAPVGAGNNTTYFAGDGTHLTQAGFAVVVSAVYTAVSNMIASNAAIASVGTSQGGGSGRSLFSGLTGSN